jgi:hypothetical protein
MANNEYQGMVALREIIAGNCEPYGLFHATRVPLAELRQKGIRANARGRYEVHDLVERLLFRLGPLLSELPRQFEPVSNGYYPLGMSLVEQLATAPVHYSGVVFTLERADAQELAMARSEPERKARALVEVARKRAPEALEALMRSDGQATGMALKHLKEGEEGPYVLLRLIDVPEDGFFSQLGEPTRDVTGMMRNLHGSEHRPEARAILFNGIVPPECFEVVQGP